LKLFGFEDESFFLVEINASVAGRAVGMFFNNGKFKEITGVRMIVWARNVEQIAQLNQERLRVGAFGWTGGSPVSNEILNIPARHGGNDASSKDTRQCLVFNVGRIGEYEKMPVCKEKSCPHRIRFGKNLKK